MFDRQKLAWVNNQYMKTKDTETVFELALPHLIKANLIPENPSEEDREWGRKLMVFIKRNELCRRNCSVIRNVLP